MKRVQLHPDWQGGDAFIDVEADAIASDTNGDDVFGVILRVTTAIDLYQSSEIELGAGKITVFDGKPAATLEFSVAGTDEQIRELAHALLHEIGDE